MTNDPTPNQATASAEAPPTNAGNTSSSPSSAEASSGRSTGRTRAEVLELARRTVAVGAGDKGAIYPLLADLLELAEGMPVFAPLYRRTGATIEIDLGEEFGGDGERFHRLDLALRHVLALAFSVTVQDTLAPVTIGRRSSYVLDAERPRRGNLGVLGAAAAPELTGRSYDADDVTGWLAAMADESEGHPPHRRALASAAYDLIDNLRKEAAAALEAKARLERALSSNADHAIPIERTRAWLLKIVNFAGSTQQATENALALLVWLYYAEPAMPGFFTEPPRAIFGDHGERTYFNGPSLEQAIAWMERIESFGGSSAPTKALARWIRERFEGAVDAMKAMVVATAAEGVKSRERFVAEASAALEAMRGADWLAGHPQYDADAAAIHATAEKVALDIFGGFTTPVYLATHTGIGKRIVDEFAGMMRSIARLRREYAELEKVGGVMRIDRMAPIYQQRTAGGPDQVREDPAVAARARAEIEDAQRPDPFLATTPDIRGDIDR